MILGNDISNFQGKVDFATYIRNSNFVICKASEGTGYIDTWFGYNRSQSRLFNLPRGWYHFARPDTGNTPQQEADFFCNLMNGDPLEEGEIVALDFEVNYSDPVTWCKGWLDAVNQKLGVKPLIYLNQSTAKNYDWQPVINGGYGLWIAAYTYDPNNNNVETGKWPMAAMQQWTDTQGVPGIIGSIDGDVFFGTVEQFKAYGYHKVITPTVQPAPVSEVTPTTTQTNPETTTTSTGEMPSTVVITSTPTITVPVSYPGQETPPVQPNVPPLPTPTKPKMDSRSRIVFLLTNIFNTLLKLLK